MSRQATAPKPGVQKNLPLKLPTETEIDLHIFCELHFGASRTKVIDEALTRFIRHQLESDPLLKQEFAEAKSAFMLSYSSEKKIRLLSMGK